MKRIVILVSVLVTSLAWVGWAQSPSPSLTAFGTSDGNGRDTRPAIANCAVITKPGSYVLTKNINATQKDLKTMGGSAPSCILIVADFVSLDLNGYAVMGPGSGFGIYSAAAGGTETAATYVSNGGVSNFDGGIALEGRAHTAENVRVVRNGVGLTIDGWNFRVEKVQAQSNGAGILCFGGFGHSVGHSEVYQSGNNGM